MFYHCFTHVWKCFTKRPNQGKSECDVLLLGPYKQGITPRRLHTVTHKVSGKGAVKKIKVTLSLADMGR